MITLRCHFDGKSLVPDEPAELPQGTELVVHIEQNTSTQGNKSSLGWLFDNAIDDPTLPADLSYQLDHYLYGQPRKP